MLRVAIAGAGFSGAILARQLMRNGGVEVVCFEKMAQKSVRKYKLRLHCISSSQDNNITSYALSRCQKNSIYNPPDVLRQRQISRPPGCAASEGQRLRKYKSWLHYNRRRSG